MEACDENLIRLRLPGLLLMVLGEGLQVGEFAAESHFRAGENPLTGAGNRGEKRKMKGRKRVGNGIRSVLIGSGLLF